jgi:hypothetical protein
LSFVRLLLLLCCDVGMTQAVKLYHLHFIPFPASIEILHKLYKALVILARRSVVAAA